MVCGENAKEHAPCSGKRCPMNYTTNIDPKTCKSRGECPWYTPEYQVPMNSSWAGLIMLLFACANKNGAQDDMINVFSETGDIIYYKKENDDVRNPE